jgi:hypothetical protein
VKENEKPLNKDPLYFIPLKLREILQRLAVKDRRANEIAEILWLIEEYAAGRLRYTDEPVTPRVSLDGQWPRDQYPSKIAVHPAPSQDVHTDLSSLREKE